MPLSHLPSRRVLLLLWLSYAFFIVYVTTLPFDFSLSLERAAEKLARVPRHPFLTPGGDRASFPDMVQNIVLFLPFGGLAALASSARQRFLVTVVIAGATGCALSALVETLQLFSTQRTSSLNDVFTNTVGSLVGAVVTLAAVLVVDRARAAPRVVAAVQRSYPVLLWAGVTAVATWHPFDATVDVGEVGGKIRGLLQDPWQAGVLADEGADLLRYVLLGASAVIVARRWSIARPALVGGLLTALFGCMLEASQLFIDSRAPGGKDAVVAASGAFLGALLLARQRAWPVHSSATVVIVAGWLAASLIVLSPYVFSSERRPMESVPFAGYIGPQPERTVSHAVELTLAFFPVGFALAFLARGRYRWMLIGAVAVVSGGTLEYLQGWIVGRYPDVTDVGMLVMGALAGAWAAFPLLPVRPPTL